MRRRASSERSTGCFDFGFVKSIRLDVPWIARCVLNSTVSTDYISTTNLTQAVVAGLVMVLRSKINLIPFSDGQPPCVSRDVPCIKHLGYRGRRILWHERSSDKLANKYDQSTRYTDHLHGVSNSHANSWSSVSNP